jgi:hypothetical protein
MKGNKKPPDGCWVNDKALHQKAAGLFLICQSYGPTGANEWIPARYVYGQRAVRCSWKAANKIAQKKDLSASVSFNLIVAKFQLQLSVFENVFLLKGD